jgi:phosphocarrier protein
MTRREVAICNKLGLHARAAAKFVHLATRYVADVRVAKDGRVMDGKSIMGILLLSAAQGTTIVISADGPDEQDAISALVELVDSGFGEDAWSA